MFWNHQFCISPKKVALLTVNMKCFEIWKDSGKTAGNSLLTVNMKCFEIETKIIFGLVVLGLTVNMKCFEIQFLLLKL